MAARFVALGHHEVDAVVDLTFGVDLRPHETGHVHVGIVGLGDQRRRGRAEAFTIRRIRRDRAMSTSGWAPLCDHVPSPVGANLAFG